MDRRAYAAALLVGGALVAQAGMASPASAATIRYAAATGSGAACTAAAPCSLETAFQLSVANGDEIVVNPGTYTITNGLSSSASNLRVHGVLGQPRPLINSSAATALNLSGAGTTLSDLTINHSGSTWGINVFASAGNITVQRLEVHSAGFATCELGTGGTVRDTLCVNTGSDGVAVEDSWGNGTGTLKLRNVTAVATGTASYGLKGETLGNNSTLAISATDVIASGVAADVRAVKGGTGSATVVMAYSDYDTTSVVTGGTVTPAGSPTNQTAAPVYLETTTYRQARTSPTVDRGATTPESGTADLDGDPRVTGAAPDIGVDELDVTPPDTSFGHTPKHRTHKRTATFTFTATEPATFTCKLDRKRPQPCTSPFRVRLKRHSKHHTHTLKVTASDAVGNVDTSPAAYSWKYRPKKRGRHTKHHH